MIDLLKYLTITGILLIAPKVWSDQSFDIYRQASLMEPDAFMKYVAGGIDVNSDEQYCPPICKAALQRDPKALRNLLRAGAKVNTKGRCQPMMYLFQYLDSERKLDAEMLRLFLEAGAKPDSVSSYCRDIQRTDEIQVTAMMFASIRGDIRSMETLLSFGADINFGTKYGTPLTRAATWCNIASMEYLLSKNADINQINQTGLLSDVGHGSAFPICHQDETSLSMIAILEKYNYRFDPANSEVLESATHSDSKKLIQYLIETGYRVLPQTANGVAILESLLDRQYYVEYKLLSKGASTKQKNMALQKVLGTAVEACDLPQTQALISLGAQIKRINTKAAISSINGHEESGEGKVDCRPMKAYLKSKGLR